MILSVSYNFYNGEEHLLPSLESIRAQVDYISVVFQEISNKGEKASNKAVNTLHQAVSSGLVDELVVFKPDLLRPPVFNELKKRKIGLEMAKKHAATHFFTMDADEFYRAHEIAIAKGKIESEGYSSTSVSSFLHIKRPIYRGRDTTNCAFITKIEKETTLGTAYPVPMVDPTRKISTENTKHYHFSHAEVAMYHMNMVRVNLKNKLNNSSTTDKELLESVHRAFVAWDEGDYFDFPRKGRIEIREVENEFKTYDPSTESGKNR